MKTNRVKVIILIVVMLFQFVLMSGPAGAANITEDYLQQAVNLVQENYMGAVSDLELMQSLFKGLLNNLDNYTGFYTSGEVDSFISEIEGKYVGIGAVLIEYGDYAVIYKVLPDSPAQKAGLLPGDKISAVNDVSCLSLSLAKTMELIKGEKGTVIVLDILRKGYAGLLQKEITLSDVKINPVISRIIGGVGYIKITSFNENVEDNFLTALNTLDSSGINKLVLDLRDNPGGDVFEAVAVARELVPKGPVTRIEFKSEDSEDVEYYSDLAETKYKLAVLVNGYTASASEILAGAIQDNKAGLLIGTKTFGKSKVQSIFPLFTPTAYEKYKNQYGSDSLNAYDLLEQYEVDIKEDEVIGWAKITTGEYFTPKGRRIDGQGLIPEIIVNDYSLVKGIDVHEIDKLRRVEKPVLGYESVDVINAEKILRLLGYNVNDPDIELDYQTFASIKQYQQDKGFYPYGVLDHITQQALNSDLDRLILDMDRQLGKAVEVLD